MAERIYRLSTGTVLSPFGDPVGDAQVHGQPLREHQRAVFAEVGLELHDVAELPPEPCFWIEDHVYLTYHAAKAFVRAVRANGASSVRAALRASPMTERYFAEVHDAPLVDVDGVPHRVYALGFRSSAPERPLPLPHEVKEVHAPVKRWYDTSGTIDIGVSKVFLFHVQHWSGLLAANGFGLYGLFARAFLRRPWTPIALLLKALWRARSLVPARLWGKTYLAGKGCRIHPTAVIEASVLGDGVIVHPYAVIRFSVIGSGTEVNPHTVVVASNLGAKVVLYDSCRTKGCVLYPEVENGQVLTQFCVVGRAAILSTNSYLYDMKLLRPVTVRQKGKTVSTGTPVLGSCIGHDVFLGGGVSIESGREVPNHTQLVRHPEQVVRKIPADAPQHEPLCCEDGNLVPVEQRRLP